MDRSSNQVPAVLAENRADIAEVSDRSASAELEAMVGDADVMYYATNLVGTGLLLAGDVLAMKGEADLDAIRLGDDTFVATRWLIHRAYKEVSSVETIHYYRTVLMDRDGRTIAFGSIGVLKSMAVLIKMLSAEEWARGVPLKVIRQKTGRGRQFLTLRLVSFQ